VNIKDPEAYRLASAIAGKTGKSLTQVVIDALRAEHQRLVPAEWDKLDAVVEEVWALPDRDPRSSDEIIADLYDENGLPRR
jgi:antitoxin VapB